MSRMLRVNAADPTRTTSIRNAFVRDITRRFKKIEQLITESIVKNDALALRPLELRLLQALPPDAFRFDTDAQKVNRFMEWLHGEVNRGILGIAPGDPRKATGNVAWSNIYIDSAYKQGMKRADKELIKAGIKPSNLPEQQRIFSIDARFSAPIHADRVGLIYTRVYTELKGITDEMERIISERLAEGMAEGRSPRVIARHLNDAIEKRGLSLSLGQGRRMRSIDRARVLARTEVIRAHHVATINTYREAGIEGVKIKAEWSTAGDDRVCPDCAFMDGRIFTLDEIEGLIPLHPQCRCVALPVLPTTQTPSFTQKERAEGVGSSYVSKKGTAKRQRFFEGKTGKRLPKAPAPGKAFKVPEE